MKKSKRATRIKDINPIIVIVAIIIIFSFIGYAALMQLSIANAELVLAWPGGVLEVEDNFIILGRNCTAIIAETSKERAQAIEMGLHNIIPVRPTTYDTVAQVLKSYNITLDRVELQRYDGTYYYADAIFTSKDKQLRLDIMPSDGIALALRTNASIFINKTLLDSIGENICL